MATSCPQGKACAWTPTAYDGERVVASLCVTCGRVADSRSNPQGNKAVH